jgi:hypothetical protein
MSIKICIGRPARIFTWIAVFPNGSNATADAGGVLLLLFRMWGSLSRLRTRFPADPGLGEAGLSFQRCKLNPC